MTLLINYFDSDDIHDEAMYFTEAHGFLTSIAIQAGSLSQQHILDEIFADSPVNTAISQAIADTQSHIEQALLNGNFPDILSAEDDDESLTLWASGFMQGVFSQEDAWFAKHPEEVAELTLPILSCAELLDDDDMNDIQQSDDIMDDMAEKIPDCVIDLFLLFNTPESP